MTSKRKSSLCLLTHVCSCGSNEVTLEMNGGKSTDCTVKAIGRCMIALDKNTHWINPWSKLYDIHLISSYSKDLIHLLQLALLSKIKCQSSRYLVIANSRRLISSNLFKQQLHWLLQNNTLNIKLLIKDPSHCQKCFWLIA